MHPSINREDSYYTETDRTLLCQPLRYRFWTWWGMLGLSGEEVPHLRLWIDTQICQSSRKEKGCWIKRGPSKTKQKAIRILQGDSRTVIGLAIGNEWTTLRRKWKSKAEGPKYTLISVGGPFLCPVPFFCLIKMRQFSGTPLLFV